MHSIQYHHPIFSPFILPALFTSSHDIKLLLERYNQLPLILADLVSKELLECIDTLPANARIQNIALFEMAAVERLIRPFDFDSDGGLTLFTDRDLLVIALN